MFSDILNGVPFPDIERLINGSGVRLWGQRTAAQTRADDGGKADTDTIDTDTIDTGWPG